MLKNVNEKKACRFAAEFLFPEEVLNREVRDYCRSLKVGEFKSLNFNQIASFIILMTIKYQMPLKAVIYRLEEEKFIDDVIKYIENYGFIKKVLQEIFIFSEQVAVLYGTANNYIIPYSKTYQDMETSFISGNASREEIIKDAKVLSLDMNLINEFVKEDEIPNDEEDDDEELFSIINAKRG